MVVRGAATFVAVIESAVASLDGTDIWISDSQGGGPFVVLLHGATMTAVTDFETWFAFGDDGRIVPVADPTVASVLREAGRGAMVETVSSDDDMAGGPDSGGRSAEPPSELFHVADEPERSTAVTTYRTAPVLFRRLVVNPRR
jgi:hypothetical protein